MYLMLILTKLPIANQENVREVKKLKKTETFIFESVPVTARLPGATSEGQGSVGVMLA